MRRALKDQLIVVGLGFGALLFWKLRVLDAPSLGVNAFAAGDLFVELYPMWHRAADWMRSGTIPLWNPFQLCGLPFLATLQYGIFYPLNAPVLFLPTAVAIECVTVLHLFAAGTFMYLYARAIQLTRTAALAAGVTFMWSGFLVGQALRFTPGLAAAVWLPLGFLAIEKLFQQRAARWAVLLGVALAMPILSGFLQTWTYSMYALAGYIGTRIVAAALQRSQRRRLPAICALVALAVVLGASLAAVQILPTYELLRLTPRRPGGLSLTQTFPFGALPAAQLLAEIAGGTPSVPRDSYVGMVALILASLAVFLGRPRLRVIFLAGLAVAGITIALSVDTPLFPLFRMLPLATWFRVPWRILSLYAFAIAVLSGIGFDAIVRLRAYDRQQPRYALVLAVVAVGCIGGWLWIVMPARSRIYFFLGSVAVWTAVALRFPSARRLVPLLLLCLLVVDLFTATHGVYQRPYHGVDVLDAEHEAFDFIANHQGLDRTYIHNIGLALLDWSVMVKQGTLRGIYSLTDYEPLSLARTGHFFRLMERPATQSDVLPFNGMLETDPSRAEFRLLSLLSVRYLVTPQRDARFHGLLEAAHWRLAYRPLSGRYLVYESPDVLPRAYVAHDVIAANDEAEALAAITAPSFDARKTAVIEAVGAAAPVDHSETNIEAASITRYEPSRVVVESNAPRPGYLVLTDTFYPGWEADVDGERQPIERANSLFRAVRIAAGHHTVTFVYRPRSFVIGALITLAALCSMVCVGAVSASRNSR